MGKQFLKFILLGIIVCSVWQCQTKSNAPTPQSENLSTSNAFLLAGSSGKIWKTHDMLDNQTGFYQSYKHTIDSCSHDDIWEFNPNLTCRQHGGQMVCQSSSAGYYNNSNWELRGNDSLITNLLVINLTSSYKIIQLTSDTLVLQNDLLILGVDTVRIRRVYVKQ